MNKETQILLEIITRIIVFAIGFWVLPKKVKLTLGGFIFMTLALGIINL